MTASVCISAVSVWVEKNKSDLPTHFSRHVTVNITSFFLPHQRNVINQKHRNFWCNRTWALLSVKSRQMRCKHITVRHQSTNSAPLCRLNYWSHGIDIFSDFWSSLIIFGNISENKITLTKGVALELKFSRRNRKCEKWIYISGCKMGRHCSVGEDISPKRRIKWY